MSVAYNALGVDIDSEGRRLHDLERAVSIALSPLDFAEVTQWSDALTAALCQLADAKAGATLLPDATPRWRAVSCHSDSGSHEAACGIHEEATERLYTSAVGDLVFWVRDDLEVEGQRPIGPPVGTLGIRVRTASGDVAAVCLHRDRALGVAPYQLIAALRAVAPAFRAGVSAWTAAHTGRSNVVRMLDSLADPALLFDIGGQLVHANPAVSSLTGSVDVARLRSEAQRIAWALGATARRHARPGSCARPAANELTDGTSVRSVRFGTAIYRLRGSIVGQQLLGAEPGVLVTMTVAAAEPLSDDTLHAVYGLTAREIQVARLIAEGLSNNQIGDRLGIRFFTARNHVERTLAKLGVASRHRVGPLLRNESDHADTGTASAA